MVTEANEHEGHHFMGNPRSSSVTGKYNDNAKHGNLFGAGALSSAASQAIQPSLDGFGGIVGVSAGTKSKQSNSVQNQNKKKDDPKNSLGQIQTNNSSSVQPTMVSSTTNGQKGGQKISGSTPSGQDSASGMLSIAGMGVHGSAVGGQGNGSTGNTI